MGLWVNFRIFGEDLTSASRLAGWPPPPITTLADHLPLGWAEADKTTPAGSRCQAVQTRTQLTNLQGDEPPVPERMFASVAAEKKVNLWIVMKQFGTAELHRNDTVEGETELNQNSAPSFDTLHKTEILVVTSRQFKNELINLPLQNCPNLWQDDGYCWCNLKEHEQRGWMSMNHLDCVFSQWTLFILSPSALAICGIPLSGQKSAHSIGTRRKIDTTREWREQTSISSGLAWKKKRLRDLFGRNWHLECINNQFFFFFFL